MRRVSVDLGWDRADTLGWFAAAPQSHLHVVRLRAVREVRRLVGTAHRAG